MFNDGWLYEENMRDPARKAATGLPRDHHDGWQRRQQECDRWYADLARDAGAAASCFQRDYSFYAAILGSLTGRVLDVGGGNGVTRHYLTDAARYVCVEPSATWLTTEWGALAVTFPCLASRPPLVHGVGERLPFLSNTFDAALSLWSLNHVQDPGEVLGEVARVLRPAGRFLLVLEDMTPSWMDFLHAGFWDDAPRARPLLGTKIRCALTNRPWPVQTDHLAIDERQLLGWLATYFHVVARRWTGGYLSYELIAR
jgi:SAM-dependent methyltransferase